MCFFRKTNKRIAELENRIAELTKLIKDDEFQKAKKDSETLKLKEKLLSLIKIKVEKATIIDNEENYSIRVKYSIPDIVVEFDENNIPLKNDLFYAINYLELLSIEDFQKLNNEFSKVKNLARK